MTEASPEQPLRVVVVDDDDDFRLLLRVQLNLQPDVEVVATAADGAEALEVVTEVAPDAVAVDLQMPVMDGFAAIEELQRARPDLGIVAYTAVLGQDTRARIEQLGVALVPKSGDPLELLEALHRSTGPSDGSCAAPQDRPSPGRG